MQYIFRRRDSVHLYTAQDRPGSFANEWAACLRNEGGAPEDYVVVERSGPVPAGMVPALKGSRVEFVQNPKRVAREAARALLAKKLGLTAEEMALLAR
tara:strand:- start:251 stop:544 length:294 start_codon:yes stop_codon:yes gene_type:complete